MYHSARLRNPTKERHGVAPFPTASFPILSLASLFLPNAYSCGIYRCVVFIESKAFTRRLRELAKDESDAVMIEIQSSPVESPMRGALVKGLGGIRKARLRSKKPRNLHRQECLCREQRHRLAVARPTT